MNRTMEYLKEHRKRIIPYLASIGLMGAVFTFFFNYWLQRPPQIIESLCENQENPKEVETLFPKFSWKIDRLNLYGSQTGAVVQVGSTPGEADLWNYELNDSRDLVTFDENMTAGSLIAGKQYYWQVMARVAKGNVATSWSRGTFRIAPWVGPSGSKGPGGSEIIQATDKDPESKTHANVKDPEPELQEVPADQKRVVTHSLTNLVEFKSTLLSSLDKTTVQESATLIVDCVNKHLQKTARSAVKVVVIFENLKTTNQANNATEQEYTLELIVTDTQGSIFFPDRQQTHAAAPTPALVQLRERLCRALE